MHNHGKSGYLNDYQYETTRAGYVLLSSDTRGPLAAPYGVIDPGHHCFE